MTDIDVAACIQDYFTLVCKNLSRSEEKAKVKFDNLSIYATLDGGRYTEANSTANGEPTHHAVLLGPETRHKNPFSHGIRQLCGTEKMEMTTYYNYV